MMIKKIILFSLLLLAKPSYSSVSALQAKKVWRELGQKSIKLLIINTNRINAFADPRGSVFITKGMLRYLNTESDLTMILGHELAHLTRCGIGGKKNELCCDEYGYRLAKLKGYKNPEKLFLRNIRELGKGGDKEHPTWAQRYDNLIKLPKRYNLRFVP